MQYCKNCGRQLKDGTRFCDRCGKSVRQSRNTETSKRQEQIEKLQRERLARKKRLEERERLDQKKNERRAKQRKQRNKVLICISAVIAAIIIIAVISFIITSSGSDESEWNVNEFAAVESTGAVPTMKPSETGEPATTPPKTETEEYRTYTLENNMKIPYPYDFEAKTASGDQELRLTDGEAVMEVYVSEYPGGTPSGLMKSYTNKLSGRTTYELTGNNWYIVTFKTSEGKIIHRKYIIDSEKDLSLYYDFTYSADSENSDEYEKYIDYIDEAFGSSSSSKSKKTDTE
jgi:hypothetical protein